MSRGASSRSGHHFAGQRTHLNGLEVVVEHIYGVTDEFLRANPNNGEGGGGERDATPTDDLPFDRVHGTIELADSINDPENPQYLDYA